MELKRGSGSEERGETTVVLVHGAFHGSWCWDFVVEELTSRGIPVLAVDLPSGESSRHANIGLAEDAAKLRDGVAGIAGSAIVCGHSYGGMVISEAMQGLENVDHLVYLAAAAPRVGECMLEIFAGEEGSAFGASLRELDNGRIGVDAELASDIFYHDCKEEIARWAVSNLAPHTLTSFTTPASRAPWMETDSTYIICSEDRVIPVSVQEKHAKRCRRSVCWTTSHSPMLSQPSLLATLLAELAT